jgi:hypothetical protein
MKKLVTLLALVALAGVSMAQSVTVERHNLGSGSPEAKGRENAAQWDNNIYHAPQYMPGHPTAATLYPRVVDVPCVQTPTGMDCSGYSWMPEMGRAEYLMIRPVMVKAPEVKIVEKIVPVPFAVPGPERIILKEVPAKPIKE